MAFAPSRTAIFVYCALVGASCGYLYLFASWSPQYAKHLGLTPTQAGNMAISLSAGSSIMGIFAGHLIDSLSPQITSLIGGVCTCVSYLILRWCYVHQRGYYLGLAAAYVSGFASIAPEYAAVKAMATNFSDMKGLATSVPVGTFALSSLVLSVTIGAYFKDDVPGLLCFIAVVNGGIISGGYFFVREVRPDTDYELVGDYDGASNVSRGSNESYGAGIEGSSAGIEGSSAGLRHLKDSASTKSDVNTVTILSPESGDLNAAKNIKSRLYDVYLRLTNTLMFQIFTSRLFIMTMLALTCLVSVGQTYIFSVGYIIQSQYVNPQYHYSHSQQHYQNIQVSVFSFFNFCGRICSGFVSDLIVARLKIQRLWAITVCVALLVLSQMILLSTNNLDHFYIVSVIIGFAFGIIFGTFPSVVSDDYHSSVYSTVWGTVTTGPFITNAFLTHFFSREIQKNSEKDEKSGTFLCYKGTQCYHDTFVVTQVFCVLGLACVGYLIWYKSSKR